MNLFQRFVSALVLVTTAQYALADLVNGDFEAGNLSGWTASNNGDAAAVQVASGQTVTDAGTIEASPTGDYYVFTSQSGPGSSYLTQVFTVEPGTNRIFFDIAINNAGGAYHTPDPISFDYTGPANQQARFDILVPGAALDTVNPSDIIVTGFQTQPGDPLVQDWTSYNIDVTSDLAPYVGQDVIFRFVQVDNQGYFNLALDNVNVGLTASGSSTAEPATPVPTMSAYGMALTMLGLLLIAAPRLRASARKE